MAIRLLSSRVFWVFLWACLAVSTAVFSVKRPLNGDVAWYLYVGNRILDGATLYRDVNDPNPPIVSWFHVPFCFLFRLFRIPPGPAFSWLTPLPESPR